MSWKNIEPDFKTLNPRDLFLQLPFWQNLNLLASFGQDLMVLLKSSAKNNAYSYVSSISVESGGLMIGRVYSISKGSQPIVLIEDCIPSSQSYGTSVSLKMDSSVWSDVNKRLAPNQYVVGWFHSHPNLGAFFSGTDRETQSNFFRENHHIGWVIDPIRKEEAWFSGKESLDISKSKIFEASHV